MKLGGDLNQVQGTEVFSASASACQLAEHGRVGRVELLHGDGDVSTGQGHHGAEHHHHRVHEGVGQAVGVHVHHLGRRVR